MDWSSNNGGALGRLQGVTLYIGAVLGSGVLMVPALAAEAAGPASLIAWVLMALLTLPLALTMANLAARFPGGGGVSGFATIAFGQRAGKVTGWLFLLSVPVAAPVASLMAAGYAVGAFGLPPGARVPVAMGIVIVAITANYLGMRTAGWVQVAVVSGIILILAAAVLIAVPQVAAQNFAPFAPYGALGVGKAAALLFWCFVGWEAVTHLSGEFADPRRDLVPAVLWAAVFVTLLYTATAAAVVGTGSYGPEGRSDASLVLVLRAGLGPAAGWLTGAVALFCVLATANAYIGAAAHLARTLAQSGGAPAVLERSHPRLGTPLAGLGFVAVGCAITFMLVAGGVTDIRGLILAPTANFVAVYVMGSAAGVRLAQTGWEKALAAAALLTSLAVVPFLGWSALYPAAVGMAGMASGRLAKGAARVSGSPAD
ncbi:MAG TPA: amino acid permease [Symbiobacteriaceae bacterium]|nr:amino acid permease [Symbiobacteriaceae bacterium]